MYFGAGSGAELSVHGIGIFITQLNRFSAQLL
jgi:hypothetical protein